MVKESYDTEAKRRIIEKQRDFIHRHLIIGAGKKPENLRVAFFPGTEALESRLCYETLGIPPNNITALERDSSRHEYWLRDNRFNVTKEPIEALDFFRNYQGQPFDIISLDYDGPYTRDTHDTIEKISKRQCLTDKGIFISNFYAKRDPKETKKIFDMSIAADYFGAVLGAKMRRTTQKLIHLDQPLRNNGNKILNDADLNTKRDVIITDNIITIFIMGSGESELYERYKEYKTREKSIDPRPKSTFRMDKSQLEREKEVLKSFADFSSDNEALKIMSSRIIDEHNCELGIVRYLMERGHIPGLYNILQNISSRRYFVHDLASYSYTSDKGAIMFTDFFYLDQEKNLHEKYKEYYDSIFTVKFREGPFSENHIRKIARIDMNSTNYTEVRNYEKSISRDITKLLRLINRTNLLQKRIYLGSSFKPPIRSKNSLRKLVEQGLSREEIERDYRVAEHLEGSLSAFLAHRTMGTYEKEPDNSHPKEELEKKVERFEIQPKAEELFQIAPLNHLRRLSERERLSENAKLRIVYFDEDVSCLNPERKRLFYDSIFSSEWYKDLYDKKVSDTKIYAFFDDLKLRVRGRKNIPDSEEVKSMWKSIINAERLYEVIPIPMAKRIFEDIKNRKIKKKLSNDDNESIYQFIQIGIPDREIMETFNLSSKELGARKAWITMRKR